MVVNNHVLLKPSLAVVTIICCPGNVNDHLLLHVVLPSSELFFFLIYTMMHIPPAYSGKNVLLKPSERLESMRSELLTGI